MEEIKDLGYGDFCTERTRRTDWLFIWRAFSCGKQRLTLSCKWINREFANGVVTY